MRNLFSYVPSKEEQHKQLWETEDYELVSGVSTSLKEVLLLFQYHREETFAWLNNSC